MTYEDPRSPIPGEAPVEVPEAEPVGPPADPEAEPVAPVEVPEAGTVDPPAVPEAEPVAPVGVLEAEFFDPPAPADPEPDLPPADAERDEAIGQDLPLPGQVVGAMRVYLQEICAVPPLAPGEEEELAQKICDGDEAARQRLLEAKLQMVVSVASRYLGRGLTLIDLVQEGNTGLLRAVEEMASRRDPKLSGLSNWWVRQSIVRALANTEVFPRIPVKLIEYVNKVIRAGQELRRELGRDPSEEEIAARLGMDLAELQDALGVIRAGCVGDPPDDPPETPPPRPSIEELTELIRRLGGEKELQAHLSERDLQVVDGWCGLSDGRCRSEEELAEELGVSRARIRQILMKALRRITRALRRSSEGPDQIR